MIKIQLKEYCNNCAFLEVVQNRALSLDGEICTYVSCERAEICDRIEKNLREHIQVDVIKNLKAKGIEV